MNNRPSTVSHTSFGLVAWLETTRIRLPLKAIDCAFEVSGDLLDVEMDQVFQQNSDKPLDCLYTFPLPAAAVVYRCQMIVNGRTISARVEERERAREFAQQMKAAGHRTTLAEMERDNLFTLSLGNLQPGDLVVVRFSYFQTLARLDDWVSFHIPFCPGVRYIPGTPLLRSPSGRGTAEDTDQVPDASRISPPRIDSLHPDAARLSVCGSFELPLDQLKELSSPSHPVAIRVENGRTTVSIADGAAVPDSDFALRWTEAAGLQTAGWCRRNGHGTFALLRLRAPGDIAVADNYEQDVYFLVDRSGSMKGLKWQKAVEAFRGFVERLGDRDRVWATFFESNFRDLAEKPWTPRKLLADPGVVNLQEMGTAGGTELLPALRHVLATIPKHSRDRRTSIVLITDGEVGNEREILEALSSHARIHLHVFGIDVTLNDGFLTKLSAQNHGSSCLMSPHDDIAGAVSRLASRLRRPVLTSIQVKDGWELPGQELPDLHAGGVLMLPLKCGSTTTNQKLICIEGTRPDGSTALLSFPLVRNRGAALPLLWARRRIDFHLARGETAKAIELAKEHNIVCEGAAFVAWDEAENVPVNVDGSELYQPVMDSMVGGARFFDAGYWVGQSAAPRGRMFRVGSMFCSAKPDQSTLFYRDMASRHQKLCSDAGHPDWLEPLQRILEWASAESNQVKSQKRVAAFTDELESLVLKLKELRRRLFGAASDLHARLAEAVSLLESVLRTAGKGTCTQSEERILHQVADPFARGNVSDNVHRILAEITSIEQRIHDLTLKYMKRGRL